MQHSVCACLRFSFSPVLSCSLFSLQPSGVSHLCGNRLAKGLSLPLAGSTVTRGCRGKTALSMTANAASTRRCTRAQSGASGLQAFHEMFAEFGDLRRDHVLAVRLIRI